MKPKCPVTYSRTTCAPFVLGIEGLKCILDAKHDCDHMGRYVAEFSREGRGDKMAEFHFRIDAPLMTLSEELMTLSEEEKFAESVEKSGRDRAAKESFIREPKS